jgi:hypothetical protein
MSVLTTIAAPSFLRALVKKPPDASKEPPPESHSSFRDLEA